MLQRQRKSKGPLFRGVAKGDKWSMPPLIALPHKKLLATPLPLTNIFRKPHFLLLYEYKYYVHHYPFILLVFLKLSSAKSY